MHGRGCSHAWEGCSHAWEHRSHAWEGVLPWMGGGAPIHGSAVLPCMGAVLPWAWERCSHHGSTALHTHGSGLPHAWEPCSHVMGAALPWHGSRSKTWEKRSHGEQIWEHFWTCSHAWEGGSHDMGAGRNFWVSRGSRQGGEESRQGARRHSGLKCSAISRRESRGPSHAPTCKSEMHRTCTRVADNRSQITASLPFPPPPPGQGQGTQHIDTPVPRVARLLQSYHLETPSSPQPM